MNTNTNGRRELTVDERTQLWFSTQVNPKVALDRKLAFESENMLTAEACHEMLDKLHIPTHAGEFMFVDLPKDGLTHDMITFKPEWIDSSGLPYGALEWGMLNIGARRDSKICMCFLLDQPAIVEISRFDESVTVNIVIGTRTRVKMGQDHYTVFTRGTRDEEQRFERRVDPQGQPIWVQTKELKYKSLPTALNCPTTIWNYQREVSKQLCWRWNDNQNGELLVSVDDVLGRYTIFNGPTTAKMAQAFYTHINVLNLNHPLDDKDKRWLNPIEFFDLLHRMAVVLGVDEDKLRTIREEAARAAATWNPAQ